ncbi:MAG: ABC transporter permease, partial [Myxococcota bacterium]
MTRDERSAKPRLLDVLTRSVSSAILFREAARTSRRWQTYGARMLFSGVLVGVVLLGLRVSLGASRSVGFDVAQLSRIGDTLFTIFCIVQLGMAMVLAPLTTAAAIIEERNDRTFDLLMLTHLEPSQIFGGKVLSRILVLLTVVLGAMPVLALVVNFGGVSTTEVVVLTGHTLVNVVLMGILGAFFGLFTRAPLLAMMASIAYALPFFLLLPFGYAGVMGAPEAVTHFSTLSAFGARDLGGLLPAIGFLPAAIVMVRLAAPLFELSVSGADFERALSDDIWRMGRWVGLVVLWGIVAVVTLPVAASFTWPLSQGQVVWDGSMAPILSGLSFAWVFLLFALLMALGTWGYLRVAVDVVDGIDGIFTQPVGTERSRRIDRLRKRPVWWREARPRAWGSSAAPILVTWGLVLLAIFQTGTWLAPGVLLAIGIGNTVAVLVLTAWLASRTIAGERRRGTLELLLVTTIGTPQVVVGKAAAAVLPTLPLMLVGGPMIALGYAYVDVFGRMDAEPNVAESVGEGIGLWAWVVPLWLCTAVASMTLATRLKHPGNAFGLTVAGLVGLLGWTPIVGRMFPDLPVLSTLARVVAPPLAGAPVDAHIVVSMLLWSGAGLGMFVALSRRLRAWIGASLVALLALGLAVPDRARAQPTPADIQVMEKTFGLRVRAVALADGLSRENRWTQVRVTIENRGAATEGDLVWKEPTRDGERVLRRRLEIPERGRKSVDLPVFRGPSPLVREIWFEAGIRQGVALVPFAPVASEDVTIGVIGRDPLGLPAAVPDTWSGPVPRRRFDRRDTSAPELERLVRTGMMPLEVLPSFAAGYDALDQVVWPSADPSRLSADQLEALLDWVADGGHLVVTITDTWRAVAASPLADALPLTLQGIVETELAPLAASLGGRRSVTGLAPTVVGSLRADRVTYGRAWSNEGRPLWAVGRFGSGTLHVLLANPAVAPLSRVDRRELWRHLLHLPVRGAMRHDLGPVSDDWPGLEAAL